MEVIHSTATVSRLLNKRMPCSICGFPNHTRLTCGKQKEFHFKINKELKWIEFEGEQYKLNKGFDFDDDIEYTTGMYYKDWYLEVFYTPAKSFKVYKRAVLKPKFIHTKEELNTYTLDSNYKHIKGQEVSFELV
jgi:hypothetical protein